MNEFTELLSDPAHWAFEMVTDITFTAALFLVGRIPFQRWVKRHDREEHGTAAHLHRGDDGEFRPHVH